MLFIIWCLIIRTCHQSMLFELLQADIRKPTMTTLEQLFQSNVTFFAPNYRFFQEYFQKESAR